MYMLKITAFVIAQYRAAHWEGKLLYDTYVCTVIIHKINNYSLKGLLPSPFSASLKILFPSPLIVHYFNII